MLSSVVRWRFLRHIARRRLTRQRGFMRGRTGGPMGAGEPDGAAVAAMDADEGIGGIYGVLENEHGVRHI